MKINISRYIDTYYLLEKDPEIRVKITEDLRLLIRRKIKSKFKSISKFAKFLGLRKSQIIFWLTNSKRRSKAKFSMLIYLCENLNISKKIIYNNILGFSTQGSHDTVYNIPKKVVIDKSFLQGIGLYVGDGYNKKILPRIVFTNNNEDLINFYIRWLIKYFNIDSKKLRLYVYSKDLKEDDVRKSFMDLINKIKIYKNPPNNESNYKLYLSTAIYRRLLDLLIDLSKELCTKNEIYAKNYLKGIFAAEGCVHIPEFKVPHVFIEMKKGKEISHVENLFKFLKIEHKKYDRPHDETKLILYREDQIRKFNNYKIGSLNEDKQNKLNQVIELYDRRL